MIQQYALKIPGTVYAGIGALQNIPAILKRAEAKKIAVFTDPQLVKNGLADSLLALLKEAGYEYAVLDQMVPEPSYAQAQEAVDAFHACGADFIIALGGGSVMDIAKLAGVTLRGELCVKDLLDDSSLAQKRVKTLMIPTTAGTGAEATPNSIVAVPEKELKVGIVNEAMIPDFVILDAEMIRNLPRPIAAATGVDALCHAIECYTSRKATPISDLFAMQALEIIFANIEAACDNADNMEAKGNMLLASFYAGVAIASSGTTAVHALSYPLGGKYHIAHGVSNAMLLAPVMRFNAPAMEARLAKVCDRCFAAVELAGDSAKAAYVIEKLQQIVESLNIPKSLRAFAVEESDIELLVEAAMQVTRLLQNNVRELSAQDAREIYQELFIVEA